MKDLKLRQVYALPVHATLWVKINPNNIAFFWYIILRH